MKGFKKIVGLFLTLALMLPLVAQPSMSYAQGVILTATPIGSENFIHLEWTNPLGEGTTFRLYRLNDKGEWESIPAKESVKVLNIYPDGVYTEGGKVIPNTGLSGGQIDLDGKPVPDSGILKTWLLQENIDTVTIDTVSLSSFNSDPSKHLKKINGKWNYDAVFYGMWNLRSESLYPNDQAIEHLRSFIHDGGGFMTSHHTIGYTALDRGVNKLANELGVEIFTNQTPEKCPVYAGRDENGNLYPTVSFELIEDLRCDYSSYYPTGTQIQIVKKGLLTEYPFKVGDVGDIYTIPLQHGLHVFAKGDVWMKTVNPTGWGTQEFKEVTVSPRTGERGTNNFYVHTYNNTAIINSGHSFPQITQAEVRIIANTLYYLSQVTTNTSWQDRTGMDIVPPEKPQLQVRLTPGQIQVTAHSEDRGTISSYKVIAQNGSETIESNVATVELKTGIKGYSYVLDKQPDTIPDSIIESTLPEFTIEQSLTEPMYLHVVAVDNAGNASEPTHIYLNDTTPPEIEIQANVVQPTNQDVQLNVIAIDHESFVKRIQLPNGTWVDGDVASYTVSQNGTYTFKAEDWFGNVSSKSVVVDNIDKVPPSQPSIIHNIDIITVLPGTDDREGTVVTEVRINGGDWETYVAPIRLADGEYVVEARSVDEAGNESYIRANVYAYGQVFLEAIKLVENAEKYPTSSRIEKAKEMVLQLPDFAPERQELLNRLIALEYQLLLNDAIKKVEKAERYGREPYISEAETAVQALPDGADKNELQNRLEQLKQRLAQEELNKLIKEAEQKVNLAELYLREPYISNAMEFVSKLPEGLTKEELLRRLENVIRVAELENKLKDAYKKVELAEKYKREPYLSNAQESIDNLPDGEEKRTLQSRLDDVLRAIEQENLNRLIQEAEQKVKQAERTMREPYITQAEEAVYALPDGDVKNELLERLNRLRLQMEQNELEKLFAETERKVKQAEQYRREPYISNAWEAVHILPEGEQKQTLMERLLALIPNDDDSESKDGQFVPGDNVVDVADSILDPQARKIYLDWAKAVERAEKYFSRANILYVINKLESVPVEMISAYQSLYDELWRRTMTLKQIYNDMVANQELEKLISKAVTAVEMYERFATEKYRQQAQEAVDALPDGEVKDMLQQRIVMAISAQEQNDQEE